MTEKLYDVNAYLTEFDAAVVSCQVLKEGTERDVNGQLAVGPVGGWKLRAWNH